MHYKRRIIGAALGFLIGVGLLLAGVAADVIPIAVAGFVVMLACGAFWPWLGGAVGPGVARD